MATKWGDDMHLSNEQSGEKARGDLGAVEYFSAIGGTAAGHAAATAALLGVVVTVRWRLYRVQAVDGVAEGLLFGIALLLVAAMAGFRPGVPAVRALAGGAVAGLGLVAMALLVRWPAQPLQLGHAAAFIPWAAATVIVATSEELLLRGILWRWTAEAGGDAMALIATSVLFALIHVPVYGLSVVPLDFGVGLLFGGLRLRYGGPAAPVIAHVVADIATWWL